MAEFFLFSDYDAFLPSKSKINIPQVFFFTFVNNKRPLIFAKKLENSNSSGILHTIGCADKDLWALCTPIFIIVIYCRTATSYFLGDKE